MKKCSEYIKDITNYISQYGDVEIFIENDLIKQECKHEAIVIKEYDIHTEGYSLHCSKCGVKIGYETCFGKVVMRK